MKLIRLAIVILVTATIAALAQDVNYTGMPNPGAGVWTGVRTNVNSGGGSIGPVTSCNGTINLSTGCVQAILGGL